MMMSLKITSPTWIWVRVKIVIPRSYKSNNSAQLFIVRMRFSAESIIGASLSEPHIAIIDELNVRNLYIILLSLSWYVRHPRAAIEIVQEYAIYSNTT